MVIWLHYIFSYLWVEKRIFHKFKELDLCWYCQGWTGFKIRPRQFPDDLPPYRPSPGKINKKLRNHLFPRKNDRFLLPPYWPTRHCPNASMASPPLDIVKCQVKFCLLLYFLHRFLINLASTAMAGRMKSVSGPHAARGLDSTHIRQLSTL